MPGLVVKAVVTFSPRSGDKLPDHKRVRHVDFSLRDGPDEMKSKVAALLNEKDLGIEGPVDVEVRPIAYVQSVKK